VDGISIAANNLDYPLFYINKILISNILGRIATPFFFFIAGYYFFFKTTFDKNVYVGKLKKRFWTLLIPYLFWNASCLSLLYFENKGFTIQNIINAFWYNYGNEIATFPIAYQFWFVRDLIIISILSPIIYLIINKLKIFGLFLLGFLWSVQIPYVGDQLIRGLFFFALGAWFSINKKTFIDYFIRIKNNAFVLFLIFLVSDITIIISYGVNYYVHNVTIILGLISVFNLAYVLLEKNKISNNVFLSSASFYVFAIHDPWLMRYVSLGMRMLFKPQSDIGFLVWYFAVVIVVTLLCLSFYYLGMFIFPKFMNLITGHVMKKNASRNILVIHKA